METNQPSLIPSKAVESKPSLKGIKTKHLILVSVIGSLLFGISVSALVWGPNQRELDFIQYGRLMEAQVYEHAQADEKREQIDVLAQGIMEHQRNYGALQVQIDALLSELFRPNLNQSSKTGSPVLEGIFFTSYNPEVGQTDSTPCVAGGTGFDLCLMVEALGQRPIALSQDLVSWSMYATDRALDAGDHVQLVSTDFPEDPRCNGEFIVSDAMNARFTNRGDIFFMDRSSNLSCHADIYLLD